MTELGSSLEGEHMTNLNSTNHHTVNLKHRKKLNLRAR